MRLKLLAPALLLLGTVARAEPWTFDLAHSRVGFSVRHMMVSNVTGSFHDVKATVDLDEKNFAKSTVEFMIAASSIDTQNADRDKHLKSPDFFDVARFPSITFKSKKVARAGQGKLKVTGDLTIHGVTKEVVLNVDQLAKPAKDPWGNTRTGTQATAKISRKDFGLTWNKPLETGGVVVGDDVDITIDVEMVAKK